jgi:hypothetical protein
MSQASRWGCVVFGFTLLFTAGCGGGYGKKLVGTWEGGGDDGTPLGKLSAMTVEFKADGGLKVAMGPIELTGTYKVVKEDGKVLTVDSEMSFAGFGEIKVEGKDKEKTDKKTFTITFEDDDTITMNPTDKPDPKKLKRKK